MKKRLYELKDGSGEVFERRVMTAVELSDAQTRALIATDGEIGWEYVEDCEEDNKPLVNICQCDQCSTIFNGLIGAFTCPNCGDDSPTTDLSMNDVFTPWNGASNAGNEEAAEEMYEALRNGKTF